MTLRQRAPIIDKITAWLAEAIYHRQYRQEEEMPMYVLWHLDDEEGTLPLVASG